MKMDDMVLKANREEYDLIASLGGSCSAATQLKHRGKRAYSLPLDYTLMPDERPIRALPELFRTKFRDFCLPGNMTEFERAGDEYGVRKFHLEDRFTGYRVIHHFTALPSDEKAYGEQRGVLMRRVNRLYEKMASARNVLLVLNTVFPYDPGLLLPIYEAVAEQFPGVDIEIVAMQFSADRYDVVELVGGKIKVALIERPLNIVYDNQLTGPEWCWMDQIKITGLPLPEEIRKRNLIVKWAYKLWRTFGKFLENRNAGCANMRFYKFRGY